MSLSAGREAQPVAAPAAPMPTSLRKSRRLKTIESLTAPLVVTDQAIHAGWMRWVVEVLAMAAHAPSHLQRRILVEDAHRLHWTMAALALDAGLDVALVVELD